ncbi:MAG: hypothetical protein V1750_07280 [Acidobacteriota bacterium]
MARDSAAQVRMVSTAGTVLLAGVAAIGVAMLLTNWVVVDVRPQGTGQGHIIVPVPLNLLRIPLRLADRDRGERELQARLGWEERELLDALRRLAAGPDGTYTSVGSGDCQVKLTRDGSKLLIRAHADGALVQGTVPWPAVERVLRLAENGRVHALDLLDLLAAGRGELLAVDAREAVVRVTVR